VESLSAWLCDSTPLLDDAGRFRKKKLCDYYSVNMHAQASEKNLRRTIHRKEMGMDLHIDEIMYMNTSIPKRESYSILLKRNSSRRRSMQTVTLEN